MMLLKYLYIWFRGNAASPFKLTSFCQQLDRKKIKDNFYYLEPSLPQTISVAVL